MDFARQTEKQGDLEPIRFSAWKEVLARESLSLSQRDLFCETIVRFLRYCKEVRAPASVALIRIYLREKGSNVDRVALRWFYRAHRREVEQAPQQAGSSGRSPDPAPRVAALRSTTPPPAEGDQGGADWERDLVRAVRSKGFLWRTEETYRMWSARFAQFLRPKSPYAATADDVGAFLTALAVRLRAMPSTQKQALNAIVFLMQEALHRQLGEIPFQRAAPRRRVPVVLSRQECQRLFVELNGTSRLMAELMYGSGLRVLGGKGDKDRITVLPNQIVPMLRAHVERLRDLHARDREAKLPGVWLPEGLARKYPGAGESWEWPRKWLRQRGRDSTFILKRQY